MINVAIDGPVGAGKSSVARECAKRLGIIYVDTGALYRSCALFCVRNNVDISPENEQAVSELLVYQIKKYIGSYAAAMNGVDAIIFTGGIGENSPEVRAAVLKDMDFFGIELDEEANKSRGKLTKISTDASKIACYVVPTNEELLIARDTLALISK